MSKDVLIIEDEGLIALEIQDNVEHAGHCVVGIADTAEDAVEIAHRRRPDIVLADVHLNRHMDGIDAAALIRKEMDIPVVYLTAYSSDEIVRRAMKTEPYGYLLKPTSEKQLATAIRVACSKHDHDRARHESARGLTSVVRALPEAIVVTDTLLRVRYLNRRAEELFGAKTEDFSGLPIKELVNLEETSLELHGLAGIDGLLEAGGSLTLSDQVLRLEDSPPVPVRIDLAALRNHRKRIAGLLVSVIDLRIGAESDGDSGERALIEPRLRDLQSYLEVEILRLLMGGDVDSDDGTGYRDGEIDALKRVLKLMFGESAFSDLERLIPN